MKALTRLARRELGRFFQVAAALRKEGVATHMPACYVDTAWHELLAKKREYKRFCANAVGQTVSHLPTKGEGVLEWVPTYEARFGNLPSIWFTDTQGNLDEKAYERYLEDRQFKASWDCDPGDAATKPSAAPVKASWDCDPGDTTTVKEDKQLGVPVLV